MSRRILVLGADGFIGRRVVSALAASSWALPVAAGRRSIPSQDGGIDRIRLDATDAKAMRQALSGMDGVVNCVGGGAETMVLAARQIFGMTNQSGPTVVHLSSMAVYGPASGDVDEDQPLQGGTGPYADAKVECERLAAGYPRSVVLRPGCVYGPGGSQWSERIARLLVARRIGELGAGGDGIANLVHVNDVGAAVLSAWRRTECWGRAYNLTQASPPTWNDYFFDYARALGAVPIRRLSGRRIAIAARLLAPPVKLAEIAAGLVGLGGLIPPPIPPSLARLWRQEIRLLSDRAECDLGLRWTDLHRGLAETASWVASRLG
ncbi:MAG: NAD-dependent epimerase/dehydratase family protein [Telmatospirillum sp.]|nr:NAD-dependent epimerase/dehydratase family protein [Telmatospirillum sp.]